MSRGGNAPGSQPIDGPLIDVKEVYLTLLRGLGYIPEWPQRLSETMVMDLPSFACRVEVDGNLVTAMRELKEAISFIPDFWESLSPRENIVWPEGVLYTAQRLPTQGKPVIVQTVIWLTKNCPHRDWGLRVEEDG